MCLITVLAELIATVVSLKLNKIVKAMVIFMKYDWIDGYLMNKASVTKDLKIEWNWIHYQIGDKMFAAICLDSSDNPKYITLKLTPDEGEFLRKQYKDIIPGYYMNKIHWNSVNPNGSVPDDVLKDMLDKSYSLVLNSFSKKKQSELSGN